MTVSVKTHIYCFDDHRTFSDEVRKKFDDPVRYCVYSFQTSAELLLKLRSEEEKNVCRIVIIGLHDSLDQQMAVEQMNLEIRKSAPESGIILLCPPDKIDGIQKILKVNIDAYIPHNANSVLRIHNSVKRFFSEHNMNIIRRRRNTSLVVLFAFIMISLLMLLLAYIRFPQYFV